MKVSIVGITGYSGLELVKILNNHKKVELVSIHATKEVGRRLSDVYPYLTDVCDLDIEAYDVRELPEDFKAHGIFMTSGADKAIDTALKFVRNGGKILVFSSTPSDTAAYPNNEIYYRELTVLGSYSPSPDDLKDSLDLLKEGKVKVNGISTEYSLEDIDKAFKDTMANKIMKAYIKL